jgi:hypothetical protein
MYQSIRCLTAVSNPMIEFRVILPTFRNIFLQSSRDIGQIDRARCKHRQDYKCIQNLSRKPEEKRPLKTHKR